jgi:hypothetical protein
MHAGVTKPRLCFFRSSCCCWRQHSSIISVQPLAVSLLTQQHPRQPQDTKTVATFTAGAGWPRFPRNRLFQLFGGDFSVGGRERTRCTFLKGRFGTDAASQVLSWSLSDGMPPLRCRKLAPAKGRRSSASVTRKLAPKARRMGAKHSRSCSSRSAASVDRRRRATFIGEVRIEPPVSLGPREVVRTVANIPRPLLPPSSVCC